MSKVIHTIELLEIRTRPKGSVYTVRYCDKIACHERATYVARRSLADGRYDGRMFLCTEHAIDFCLQHGLDLPVSAKAGQHGA